MASLVLIAKDESRRTELEQPSLTTSQNLQTQNLPIYGNIVYNLWKNSCLFSEKYIIQYKSKSSPPSQPREIPKLKFSQWKYGGNTVETQLKYS